MYVSSEVINGFCANEEKVVNDVGLNQKIKYLAKASIRTFQEIKSNAPHYIFRTLIVLGGTYLLTRAVSGKNYEDESVGLSSHMFKIAFSVVAASFWSLWKNYHLESSIYKFRTCSFQQNTLSLVTHVEDVWNKITNEQPELCVYYQKLMEHQSDNDTIEHFKSDLSKGACIGYSMGILDQIEKNPKWSGKQLIENIDNAFVVERTIMDRIVMGIYKSDTNLRRHGKK